MSLKHRLIRLGSNKSELRDDIETVVLHLEKTASLSLVHYDFSSYTRREASSLQQVRRDLVKQHPVYDRASWDILSDGHQFRFWAVSPSDGGPDESASAVTTSTIGSILERMHEYTYMNDDSMFQMEDDSFLVRPIVFAGDAHVANEVTEGHASPSDYESTLVEIRGPGDVPSYKHTVTHEYGQRGSDEWSDRERVTYNFTEIIECVPSAPPWASSSHLYEWVRQTT